MSVALFVCPRQANSPDGVEWSDPRSSTCKSPPPPFDRPGPEPTVQPFKNQPMLRKRHPLFENGGLAVLAFAIFLLVGTQPSEAFLYAALLFAAAYGIDRLKQRK